MVRKKKRNNAEVYAVHRNICMSAQKARRIISWIRGCYYEEALTILEFMPYRGSSTIFKLIYSATANAQHNRGFHKDDLVISKVEVNEGPTRKKLKPRARGRSYLIKRPTCHITIVVQDITYDEEYERYKKYMFLD